MRIAEYINCRFRISDFCDRQFRNPHSAFRNAQTGFTLLEIIIVIFIILLVFGLSVPFFAKGLSSGRLNSTAREISATIRHARALAQINGENQTVTIDLDGKLYGIEGRGNKNIPAEVNVAVIDPLSGEELKEGKYSIVLNRLGGVEGGTSILLSQEKRILRIEADPVVGSVVVR